MELVHAPYLIQLRRQLKLHILVIVCICKLQNANFISPKAGRYKIKYSFRY